MSGKEHPLLFWATLTLSHRLYTWILGYSFFRSPPSWSNPIVVDSAYSWKVDTPSTSFSQLQWISSMFLRHCLPLCQSHFSTDEGFCYVVERGDRISPWGLHHTGYFLGLLPVSHLLGFLLHTLGLMGKEHRRGYRVLQCLMSSLISHIFDSLYLAFTNLTTILAELLTGPAVSTSSRCLCLLFPCRHCLSLHFEVRFLLSTSRAESERPEYFSALLK